MRRLGVGGLDAVQLGRLHGVSETLLVGLQFPDHFRLFDDHPVQLFILSFKVGDVRFKAIQALDKFRFHEKSSEGKRCALLPKCRTSVES